MRDRTDAGGTGLAVAVADGPAAGSDWARAAPQSGEDWARAAPQSGDPRDRNLTLGLDGQLPELSKRSILASVARRSGPHLIEATIIPAVLFYVCLVAGGLGAAYVAALGWSYSALLRRALRRDPVPPILVLGVLGITVKTVVAVVSQSSFLYFFQPILGTVAMAGVFFVSVLRGQPLIGRLAGEFWPLTDEASARPGIRRLFRNLTLLWGASNIASAAMTLSMLVWLPLEAFLPVKQVAGFALTGSTVFVTVAASLRAARSEGLVSMAEPGRTPARPPELRPVQQAA